MRGPSLEKIVSTGTRSLGMLEDPALVAAVASLSNIIFMDCKTIAVTTCGDSFIIFVEEVNEGKEEGPTKYDRGRDQCEMIVMYVVVFVGLCECE